MRRPLPPQVRQVRQELAEDDPSGDFGGLADVLEPVEGTTATGAHPAQRSVPLASPRAYVQSARMSAAPPSIRSLGPSSQRHAAQPAHPSHPGHAGHEDIDPSLLLQPVQVQDFAFADTVFARELENEVAPPSGPIFVNDPNGSTQCVTPLAFPLPDAAADAAMETRMRVGLSHARHGLRRSVEEMQELWQATAEIVHREQADLIATGMAAPPSAFGIFVRRIAALWSCWQWDRADLARAVIIGCAVFIVAAAAGATALEAGERSSAASASDSEVRVAHTLDQHTAHRVFVRAKASR